MINTQKIWMDGKLVDHDDAKIHVLSHVVHYGSGFFEGIRSYETPNGAAIFRLDEHIQRLFDSCKIYRTEVPFSQEEVRDAILEVLNANSLTGSYIRPLIFRGYAKLGVNPLTCPVNVMVSAWEWGAYLGEDALRYGIKAQTSSWRRLAPDTMPTMAKASGNYLSSQLIKMEALENGYDEGIALDYQGNVSEGSGENLFAIRDGVIYTPTITASALVGITRDTIMKIADHLGYEVKEQNIPREFLYVSDEIFLTGTAAEVTPVSSIDGIKIGAGERGPVTEKIQDLYFKIVRGEFILDENWLTYVK